MRWESRHEVAVTAEKEKGLLTGRACYLWHSGLGRRFQKGRGIRETRPPKPGSFLFSMLARYEAAVLTIHTV